MFKVFLLYLVCEKDTYIIHLVFLYKNKSIILLYKLELFILITLKVDQVKDKVIIKKETKKGKLTLKKAKVKEEEHTP
jgi:hypothetical protein